MGRAVTPARHATHIVITIPACRVVVVDDRSFDAILEYPAPYCVDPQRKVETVMGREPNRTSNDSVPRSLCAPTARQRRAGYFSINRLVRVPA